MPTPPPHSDEQGGGAVGAAASHDRALVGDLHALQRAVRAWAAADLGTCNAGSTTTHGPGAEVTGAGVTGGNGNGGAAENSDGPTARDLAAALSDRLPVYLEAYEQHLHGLQEQEHQHPRHGGPARHGSSGAAGRVASSRTPPPAANKPVSGAGSSGRSRSRSNSTTRGGGGGAAGAASSDAARRRRGSGSRSADSRPTPGAAAGAGGGSAGKPTSRRTTPEVGSRLRPPCGTREAPGANSGGSSGGGGANSGGSSGGGGGGGGSRRASGIRPPTRRTGASAAGGAEGVTKAAATGHDDGGSSGSTGAAAKPEPRARPPLGASQRASSGVGSRAFMRSGGPSRMSTRNENPQDLHRRWLKNSQSLRTFYRKYAPDMVTSANKILNKFKGREEELFAKVAAKYDAPADELVPA